MAAVRVTRRMVASRAALWRALSTPQGLATWQADEVDGEFVPGRTLTLRYRVLGASISLEVVAVEDGRRVVLAAGPAQLEMRVGEGEVTIEHSGLTPGDEADGTRSSWRVSLATLAESVERYPGRPRFVAASAAFVRAPPEVCYVYFADPTALGRWLFHGAVFGPPGVSVPVKFAWGSAATIRIIASTPGRDVALAWDEGAAVIALRTLPSPRDSDERIALVSASCWGHPLSVEAASGLRAALGRLERLLANPGAV
ncbi:MAG: SRPBCC domain-containing protein [Polyangiaceae bacterium]|nr:SRPBCC domain-containing protein [Polyangiaceae bacterium]